MGIFIKVIFIFAIVIAAVISFGGFVFKDVFSPRGGIFLSLNKGSEWKQFGSLANGGNINQLDVTELKANPKDARIFYLGTLGSGVYKSIDSGEYWNKLEDQNKIFSPRADVYNIAVDYNLPNYETKTPDRFYLASYQDNFGRIFKTEDGGLSFKEVYIVSRSGYSIFTVAIDPAHSNVVWTGTAEGLLLKSQDFGETWELIQEFPGIPNAIIINPGDTRRMFVSTFSNGVFTSEDGGANWIAESEGLAKFPGANNVEAAVRDPHGGAIYLGTNYGLLKSGDGGITWQIIDVVFPEEMLPVLSMAFSPNNPNEMYVSAGQHIYRTQDGGRFWQIRKLTTNKRVMELLVDPRNANRIFAGLGKFTHR